MDSARLNEIGKTLNEIGRELSAEIANDGDREKGTLSVAFVANASNNFKGYLNNSFTRVHEAAVWVSMMCVAIDGIEEMAKVSGIEGMTKPNG